MCIMEMRPGQRATTMAQALAHNCKTLQGDTEMFRKILIARGDVESLHNLEQAQAEINRAYNSLMTTFELELVHDIENEHNPDETIGQEREHVHGSALDKAMLEDAAENAAEIAAHRAQRYETR